MLVQCGYTATGGKTGPITTYVLSNSTAPHPLSPRIPRHHQCMVRLRVHYGCEGGGGEGVHDIVLYVCPFVVCVCPMLSIV